MNCTVCKISCSGAENFQQHIMGEKHKKMLRNHELKMEFENSSKQKEDSVVSLTFDTLTSTDTSMDYLNLTELKAFSECKICSMKFTGIEPYKQHLESKGHKKKTGSVSDNGLPNVTLSLYDCKKCNLSFSSPEYFQQHIEGIDHKKMPVDQVVNIPLNIGRKNNYSCDICSVQCNGNAPYQEHMKSASHCKKQLALQNVNASYLPQINSLIYCDICNVPCSGETCYQQHKKGSSHLKKLKMLEAEEAASSPINNLYCNLCCIQCTEPESFTKHVSGEDHQKKVQKSVVESHINNLVFPSVDSTKNNSLREEESFNSEVQPFSKYENINSTVSPMVIGKEVISKEYNLLLADEPFFSEVTPEMLNIKIFKSTEPIKF